MASIEELQALGREAHAALQAVTAQDPRHLKAIDTYMTALEEAYPDGEEDEDDLDGDNEDDDGEDENGEDRGDDRLA